MDKILNIFMYIYRMYTENYKEFLWIRRKILCFIVIGQSDRRYVHTINYLLNAQLTQNHRPCSGL